MPCSGRTRRRSAGADAPARAGEGKGDWARAVCGPAPARRAGKAGPLSFSEAQLASVSDDAAAALGYALSSPQKVALLRALLAQRDGKRRRPGRDRPTQHRQPVPPSARPDARRPDRPVRPQPVRPDRPGPPCPAGRARPRRPVRKEIPVPESLFSRLRSDRRPALSDSGGPGRAARMLHWPSSCTAWAATRKARCRVSMPSPGAACAPSPSMPACTATAPARRRVNGVCKPTMF